MLICRPEIQKINRWWKEGWLGHAFDEATTTYSGDHQPIILSPFLDIWAPTLKWNADQSKGPIDPYEWEWKNYGFDADEIAMIYQSMYGDNFFPEYFATDAEFHSAMDGHRSEVINNMKAKFLQNRLKYVKMIELAGFAYNPLNNVDAHELFSVFESHGGTKHNVANSSHVASADTLVRTHAVQPYDTTNTWKDESKDTNSSTTTGNTIPSASAGGTGGASASGSSVTKPSSVQSGASATSDSTIHEKAKNTDGEGHEEDYTVAAKNNAFEQSLKGADYYKAEKHRRYGNIGVTKTQELLEAEREQLKFNLLQEFFNDINEVVLIGVY